MTYNFDPDKWYADRRALLEARLACGELNREAFLAELEELETRYEAMQERLDGSFQVGNLDPDPGASNRQQ